jgi:hypothetical protein
MKYFVLKDYSKEPDNDLLVLAQDVNVSLTGNANFTFAAGVLAGFQTKITDFLAKNQRSQHGNSADITAKNLSRKALLTDLHDIADTVNYLAKGDLAKLKSTAFVLSKEKAKVGSLPKPEMFKVVSGNNSGDLLCSVEACPDAIMYLFFWAPVPAPDNMADWHWVPNTVRKMNISGFMPGKHYILKCAYKGTDGNLVYSEPIYIYAQ